VCTRLTTRLIAKPGVDRRPESAYLGIWYPKGMGSPKTALWADDSCRAIGCGRSCLQQPAARRGLFCPPELDDGVSMLSYLWIAVGSALGGMGRYWISGIVAQQFGETFPWGTIIVNVTGSFVIGFFATLTGPDGRFLVSTSARQFVMVGICG